MGLNMLEGQVLDLIAAGKSPRQIADEVGIEPHEAAKLAYDLLDREIVTDVERQRKLQVYRLQKLIEALWQRTIEHGEMNDVRNLREIMADMNTLLALNKEIDEAQRIRMHSYQLAGYMAALQALVAAFKAIAPNAMPEEEWPAWTANQLEELQKQMQYAEEVEG